MALRWSCGPWRLARGRLATRRARGARLALRRSRLALRRPCWLLASRGLGPLRTLAATATPLFLLASGWPRRVSPDVVAAQVNASAGRCWMLRRYGLGAQPILGGGPLRGRCAGLRLGWLLGGLRLSRLLVRFGLAWPLGRLRLSRLLARLLAGLRLLWRRRAVGRWRGWRGGTAGRRLLGPRGRGLG